MPDIVRIGGTDLVRTREANGEFTYRPVDAQTGAVVDAATFEARKKAQRQAQLATLSSRIAPVKWQRQCVAPRRRL